MPNENLHKLSSSNITATQYAATMGLFDGVHQGHRFLIENLKDEAAKRGLKSMLITFKNHPQEVLNPQFTLQLINTRAEKIELLHSLGIDKIVELEFTKELLQLSARDFIQKILQEELHIAFLLVGHDHRFGKDRAEGLADYIKYGQEIGMEVMGATRYSTTENATINSTAIRTALFNGDIAKANDLLTYPYTFIGEVISGYRVGRKIGFPTANLQLVNPHKIIPALGVYMVEIKWQNTIYKGMMNIGKRPTVTDSDHISMEVHILDFNQDIYHQKLKVSILKKIRDEQKFESIEALIEQLKKDKAFVEKSN